MQGAPAAAAETGESVNLDEAARAAAVLVSPRALPVRVRERACLPHRAVSVSGKLVPVSCSSCSSCR